MHFNWLHFTDLHCGMPAQRWDWDTVLFTGDLTNRGTRAQFDALDTRLDRIPAARRSIRHSKNTAPGGTAGYARSGAPTA